MFKKGLITLVCLTVMSALWSWAATTYSISTKINSLGTYAVTQPDGKIAYLPIIGGEVKVRNGAVQTTGVKYSNFTTSALIDVVVTPKAGYKISALTATGTGVVTPLPAIAANQTAPLTVQVQKPGIVATQYVVATFAPAGETATVSKNWQLQVQNNNVGGAIKIERAASVVNVTTVGMPLVKSYIDTTPVTVTVTPAIGYNIDYLIVDGVKTFYKNDTVRVVNVDASAGSRIKNVIAGYQRKSIRVTTHGPELITVDPVTGGTRYADNGILPANPAADATGAVRFVVTPTGSNNVVKSVTATGGQISFTDRFGAPVTLPFTGPVKATITGLTAPITVTATYGLDAVKTGNYTGCTQTCHADPALVAARPEIKAADTQWLASTHRTQNVDCVSCHQAMPGPDFSTTAAKEALCASCHIAGATPNVGHTAAQNACSTCHTFTGGHNPVKAPVAGTIAADHTGGTVLVRAQYLAQNVTCSNCHAGNNSAIIAEYKQSGHGDVAGDPWYHYDWASASRAACQRCHTTTGYQNSLPGATPVAMVAGQAAQVLTCAGCHADTATGALRAPGAFTLTTGTNAATVAFADAGASNLCIRCHAGRETGDSIVADPSATGVRGFINSHYLTAAGTVYNKGGYEYAGQSYDNLGFHKNVGGAKGSCVGCHMSAGNGHTWEFVSHDVDGNITANNSTECAKCHDGLTAADLNAGKAALHANLETLKGALEAKGIYFYPAHPYFFTAPYQAFVAPAPNPNVAFTNWAGVYGLASWKDVMGAAFNYNLIEHDPGAYAHNRQYAQKLIADSIDFLNNGVVDGDSGITVAGSTETGHSAAIVDPALGGSFASATVAGNTITATCGACHSTTNFVSSRHANQSARAGYCSACHSHEGFVTRDALGKFTGNDQLATAFSATAYPELFALPVGSSTVAGVTKKNCNTCHDNTSNNSLRGIGDETVVEGLVDGTASTVVRTKFSAEFNLCTACHMVKLDATWDTTEGYTEMGMFKYTLSADYAAENLIDGTTGTYNFSKIFYHDGASGSGRTFVDTHFGGTIASHLVNFDGATTNVTLQGYNVNPGSPDACVICHDPHTAGKMLAVAAGTTVATDDNSNAAISFATGLGGFHTDYLADPFSRGSVAAQSSSCMPCHSGKVFADKTEGAAAPTTNQNWAVVGCNSCHNLDKPNSVAAANDAAAFDDVRQFPAGYQFKFNATAAAEVPVADLGDSQVCFECHKGRTPGVDVALLPEGETANLTISYLHYAPSMAIVYGDDSKMVATYAGKSYSGRFQHPFAVGGKTNFTCTDCHNVHTGANYLTSGSCVGCHDGTSAPSAATLKADVRAFSERLLDTVLAAMIATPSATDAVLAAKLAEIKAQADPAVQKDLLMTYIEERSVKFPTKAIAHAAVSWKVFTYEDGPVDGQAHGHGGSWAHNGKFAKQVMFDAIESLGGDTTGLTRPAL